MATRNCVERVTVRFPAQMMGTKGLFWHSPYGVSRVAHGLAATGTARRIGLFAQRLHESGARDWKTASLRAVGVIFPVSLLVLADEVIEE